MADPTLTEVAAGPARATSSDPARVALTRFMAVSGSVRGAAILEGERVVAAGGDDARWQSGAQAFLAAADAAAGEPAAHAHVATEEGEVYAVRLGERAMVAVTGRFDLSSLVLADMRRALRECG